jgi:hypothetical protein
MSSDNMGGVPGALRTIARGFLLGVGFSMALGCATFVAWQISMSRNRAMISDPMSGTEVAATEIVLSDVEELKHDGMTSIIGSVKNTAKTPVHGVQIQANLFNHGKFVDQYSTYISGKLGPGESQHFKIACGCKDSPAAEHDSFKAEVVGGY